MLFQRSLFTVSAVMIAGLISILLSGRLDAAEPVVVTNSIGMNLVQIPAGEFMMGSEEDRSQTLQKYPYCDPRWLNGEYPRHRVRITRPFLMGQHEVRLNDFLIFYHDASYKTEIERDGKPSWGYENGKLVESNRFRPWDPLNWKIEHDHPVIYVSWNDAVAFCDWLSKKEGKRYRLPTEAEWEYACRAGTNHRYHYGDSPEELTAYANAADKDCQDEAAKYGVGQAMISAFDKSGKRTDSKMPFPFLQNRDGYAWTAPVGRYRPNNFGLYDMHGNVWEWCSDWYDENYYAHSPVDNPTGPATGTTHVLRGGGFNHMPAILRCAIRYDAGPTDRSRNCGFRVVRED